jgi:phosphatidylethanolamine/phosphatidyl-N-methylethanolamine N-methyltransferase
LGLRHSYTLLAPAYDLLLRRVSAPARRRSLALLPRAGRQRVLLAGIGTGLDVPYLPGNNDYVGIDITRAMLDRVPPSPTAIALVQGDSMRLPFADACFDFVVLHLIVAVVPEPARCLAEAARVLKRGGTMLVLDKFLRRGELAPLRRALNPLSRAIATRMDVVWEDLLDSVPHFIVESDEPVLARGWFRLIRARRG